ncbi:hypothetical protein LCGC14_0175710 [marine sediment metagenome]|uniref:Uncharacterized protein n=1 Tax=marine sediment metagenome TaxID=412755 RepID=A0A0F9V7K7_9ZZZZ
MTITTIIILFIVIIGIIWGLFDIMLKNPSNKCCLTNPFMTLRTIKPYNQTTTIYCRQCYSQLDCNFAYYYD